MSEPLELEKVYDPASVQGPVYKQWLEAGCFASAPDERPRSGRYTIVIPPPNVTGALHLGHALNNALQDILIRWQRMMGKNTLWLPGTDHAGIATQAVVERRIFEGEGKTRHDLGREELVRRIWAWKDQYEKRILSQLQLIGCSCDWSRTRFTLDEGLARAVRHTFFKLFKDGLIFRGKRLVNWDTQLQTAVADDEVYHETVKGHFWHFNYPVKDPKPGEPQFVTIATTRPETMLGDTAVAVHPDPETALARLDAELRDRLAKAPAKEKTEINAELGLIEVRRKSHLPRLLKLRDMARDGRMLILPLLQREIPLIADEWADPLLGSGCVKITPAHDHNDYEVGLRNSLPMINILNADGTLNENAGPYKGMTIAESRKKVVADMDEQGLLEQVEDKDIDLGHSDRSKTPIEPYLSDQWFVKMGELAPAAMDAVEDGRVQFFPPRYARSYLDWLGEKRDWCISRQLWWGHRIPIWSYSFSPDGLVSLLKGHRDMPESDKRALDLFNQLPIDRPELAASKAPFQQPYLEGLSPEERARRLDDEAQGRLVAHVTPAVLENRIHVCLAEDDSNVIAELEAAGYQRDPDVLDTWFSSALWPFSTMGWPEETPDLKYYYPSNVLVTSRDIISNWVCRMVLTGLYNMNEVPFDHVYIHTKILDARGETMSKSKGNGVDPLDVVEVYGADALRYTMADMATETQDVRMPVDYVCPHCSQLTPQASVVPHGKQPADVFQVTCQGCKKKFATQWAKSEQKDVLGVARETSEKFEVGRNFCNKVWNSARFAFMNLDRAPYEALNVADLPVEDRWILAKLSETIRGCHGALSGYYFSIAMKILRDFFWDSFCDWYIELSKPRLRDPQRAGVAKQVLAFMMDQNLRLLSPLLPFITERLWQQLNRLAPRRGIPGVAEPQINDILMVSQFPPADGWPAFDDPVVLNMFEDVQAAVRGVRDLRNKCKVPLKQKVRVTIKATQEHLDLLSDQQHILLEAAGVESLSLVTESARPRNAGTTVVGPLQLFVHDISDDEAERRRLEQELAAVEKRLAGVRAKLANEKFVNNAKPEVVEAERNRLIDLEKSLAAVQESLADLAG